MPPPSAPMTFTAKSSTLYDINRDSVHACCTKTNKSPHHSLSPASISCSIFHLQILAQILSLCHPPCRKPLLRLSTFSWRRRCSLTSRTPFSPAASALALTCLFCRASPTWQTRPRIRHRHNWLRKAPFPLWRTFLAHRQRQLWLKPKTRTSTPYHVKYPLRRQDQA